MSERDVWTEDTVEYHERPDSSNIASVAYHARLKRMRVTFRNGGVYDYEPISHETFEAIAQAKSAGKAFDFHIRKAGPTADFTTTKVDMRVLDHVKRQAPQEPPIDHVPVVDAQGEVVGWVPSWAPIPDASALEPEISAMIPITEEQAAAFEADPEGFKAQFGAMLLGNLEAPPADLACAHSSLTNHGPPLQRCPDCGRIVAAVQMPEG